MAKGKNRRNREIIIMDLQNILASLKKKKYDPAKAKLGYRFVPLSHFEGYKLKLKARNIIVVVDGSGKVVDIFPKDQKDDMRELYTQKLEDNTEEDRIVQENILIKQKTEKERKKTIAEEEMKLGLNKEKNIKLLNAMKGDSVKINDRYENAEIRYLTARAKLEEYVAGEMGTTTRERNQEKYERKLRELQNTAKYKDLANKEIQALKFFFKVSNALTGLSNELAAGDPDYQAIDYNQKVQDLVTPSKGNIWESVYGNRQIPEGDPSSIYRSEVRDYVSPERAKILSSREKTKAMYSGVKGAIEEGGGVGGAFKSIQDIKSGATPTTTIQPTPMQEYSTDELLKILIEENKKKTGK